MKIEMGKTYKTRDGREVRIYAVDGGGLYPVHGAVLHDGEWNPESWSVDGRWDRLNQRDGNSNDLIEVRPRIVREVWVNVYPGGLRGYTSREEADDRRSADRIACVRLTIDCEEGEGL